MARDIRELKYMQSLPLEQKIEMTAERIDGWYEHFDGNVAVSFSGGKDSCVVRHLVHRIDPNIKSLTAAELFHPPMPLHF